ncbi:MAG: methylmalonyl-CoA mutase family protein [Capnocytophaga sp.]|nr:methylmalonyl-CoA mutase family protein [Capnocytophaga sp.]
MYKKIWLEDFPKVSEQEIKQKINFLLDGQPYNTQAKQALIEEIFVQQWYGNPLDTIAFYPCEQQTKEMIFLENDFLNKVEQFSEKEYFTIKISNEEEVKVLEKLPKGKTYYIWLDFFVSEVQLLDFERFIFFFDPIGKLTKTGNFYRNKQEDFYLWKIIFEQSKTLLINGKPFTDAGAINIQQIAYIFSILNDYLSEIEEIISYPVQIFFWIGQNPNFSFDLAKLVAIRWLFSSIFKDYNNINLQLITQPSEYYFSNKIKNEEKFHWILQSAILGGSNFVINSSENINIESEIIKFSNKNIANSWFLKHITKQMVQKSLSLCKDIQKGGGYLLLLKEHNIQKKIKEKHLKQQELFPIKEERKQKQNKIKTLIEPILPRTSDLLGYEIKL